MSFDMVKDSRQGVLEYLPMVTLLFGKGGRKNIQGRLH
jgi:hypothetical protein